MLTRREREREREGRGKRERDRERERGQLKSDLIIKIIVDHSYLLIFQWISKAQKIFAFTVTNQNTTHKKRRRIGRRKERINSSLAEETNFGEELKEHRKGNNAENVIKS